MGVLSMLVEDTVHSTLDEAPLINAAFERTWGALIRPW